MPKDNEERRLKISVLRSDPNIKDYRNESRPIPLHNLSMHTREVLITELFNVRKANIDLQNGR